MKKISIILISFLAVLGILGFFLRDNFLSESSKRIEIVKSEGDLEEKSSEEIKINNSSVEAEKSSENITVQNDNPVSDKDKKTEAPEKEPVSTVKAPKITNKLVSWGYEKAGSRKIDTIIIHTSYDALGADPFSVEGILQIYKSYGVAAHYLISREGKIYRLVSDDNIAYHAGESKVPDGRTGVNFFSIGIELVNTKKDKCTGEQYAALESLVDYLRSTYKIKYVLGHSDIAPGRKDDPWGLEWSKIR